MKYSEYANSEREIAEWWVSETEGRGKQGVTTNGCSISSGGDEDILKLDKVIVV